MALTILGLPIGNIEDISFRAIETLKKAQVVICEDTRVFHKLWEKLKNLGILSESFSGRLEVLNDFNEKGKEDYLTDKIEKFNDEVVLVSDAGMPTFSDPGYRLVKSLIERNIEIKIVPGPTATTTALALSGLSSDKVLFLGFLPKKQSKRKETWEQIKTSKMKVTVAIYESPTRVQNTLKEIQIEFGEVDAVIARELTKEYEEVIRGKITDLIDKSASLRGEVVILFRYEGN